MDGVQARVDARPWSAGRSGLRHEVPRESARTGDPHHRADVDGLRALANPLANSEYGRYLLELVEGGRPA